MTVNMDKKKPKAISHWERRRLDYNIVLMLLVTICWRWEMMDASAPGVVRNPVYPWPIRCRG
jgi:hypothetical protein